MPLSPDSSIDTALPRNWLWIIASILTVIVLAVGLRYGTRILSFGPTFDERFTIVPIGDLITQGWSIKTAIDFEETKGPTLIWSYALMSKLIGRELNDLRLISIIWICLSIWPLLQIAWWCGLRRWKLWLAALLYLLLPYNLVLGELVMSEPLFMLNALLLMLAFMWGLDIDGGRGHPVAGPVLFAVLLSMALHNRVHAVAFAGAACMIALERDGLRSWPWWTACLIGGVSRVPLWMHWGGLVSPAYQSMHGLGFSPQSMTYLAAALAPWTGLLLWPALMRRDIRAGARWLVAAGAMVGLVLAWLAPVDYRQTLPFDEVENARFLGLTATGVRMISADPVMQRVLTTILAMVGMASLGALGTLAWSESIASARGLAHRFTLWSLLCGCWLYALTAGFVFDRYLLPWAALISIIWVLQLPRALLAAQAIVLLSFAAWLTKQWLMTPMAS